MRGLRLSLLLLLALCPLKGEADCLHVAEGNQFLAGMLKRRQVSVANFEGELAKMEQACQREQAQISRDGARAATAESCVALEESAFMNRLLTRSSENCATQIDRIKEATEILTSSFVEPFEAEMAEVAAMHQDPEVQRFLPECQQQFQASAVIHGHSTELLDRAKAAIARSQTDILQFTALGNTTRGHAESSEAAVIRCGGHVRPFTAIPLESGKGLPVGAAPRGKSLNPQSTVTGEIGGRKLTGAGSTESVASLRPGEAGASGASAITGAGSGAGTAEASRGNGTGLHVPLARRNEALTGFSERGGLSAPGPEGPGGAPDKEALLYELTGVAPQQAAPTAREPASMEAGVAAADGASSLAPGEGYPSFADAPQGDRQPGVEIAPADSASLFTRVKRKTSEHERALTGR